MQRAPVRRTCALAALALAFPASATLAQRSFPGVEGDRFPASNQGARLDPEGRLEDLTPPSPFGIVTSRRWAWGLPYERRNLEPVANPNPAPEPQPLRDHPYDLLLNADGSKLYVTLQGTEMQPGSEMVVIDLRTEETLARFALRAPDESGPPGSSPFRMALHPGGRFLLVTHRYSNFLSVVDTKKDAVVGEIPVDYYCQGITFDQDGDTAYVANRYLDQVFVVDLWMEGDRLTGAMRVLGGLDESVFFGDGTDGGLHRLLVDSCGASRCHAEPRGDFLASADAEASYRTVLEHVQPGDSAASRLLRAVVCTRYGGYADMEPRYHSHDFGTVVYQRPNEDPDYQRIARWIDAGGPGPGIPIGNPRSKPRVCSLTSDGRFLFVGNYSTQSIAVVDVARQREIGAIHVQNVVNDLLIHRSPETGRDLLFVATLGIGFGTAKERAPYTGESWDRSNPGAQYSVWRDTATMKRLPRDEQVVLGPFDATDGTFEIKFRDLQNDLLVLDVDSLELLGRDPEREPEYLLLANRYEAHRAWVRYTSDTAEATYGDIKGDIPPDLMRVVGAFPEQMACVGDRLYVSMQCSNQVQEWRIDAKAADPSDLLVPLAVYEVGLQPVGIAAGQPGTFAEGRVYTADFMGGTVSVVDTRFGHVRQIVVDPSVVEVPVPATSAERGEMLSHSALFSSDQDTSCFHCHTLDLADGRPWGVSQVLGQEFLSPHDEQGHLVVGGTMSVPQMRGLFDIQPFFFEGVISGYEPRSMIMEHCPSDDFSAPNPHGDFRHVRAHYVLEGVDDVQSKMETRVTYDSSNEERRNEMFRQMSMRLFGKGFTMRDFQRLTGEWQMHEPRLLPNPFDQTHPAVVRGRLLFEDPQVGCVSCHPPPAFTKKDFPDLLNQAFPAQVTFTVRDGSFTLMSKNREDLVNGVRRDLEPWDMGRAEEQQGQFTIFPLRGIWDRPPVFLHNGTARNLREVVCPPGHPALRTTKYEPLLGGTPERPGRREVGFNFTLVAATREPEKVKLHVKSGARIGFDTHGGTSQLTRRQIDDLVAFLNSIE